MKGLISVHWKPSKRQAQLKKRLMDTGQSYLDISRSLDQMLLKVLHKHDVYTPDDFYNRYIRHDRHIKPTNSVHVNTSHVEDYRRQVLVKRIDWALTNVNEALLQLKQLIKRDQGPKY